MFGCVFESICASAVTYPYLSFKVGSCVWFSFIEFYLESFVLKVLFEFRVEVARFIGLFSMGITFDDDG